MDAITVKLPEAAKECREFILMSADFNDANSSLAMAKLENTIPYEVCTNFSRRVPRLYFYDGAPVDLWTGIPVNSDWT